MLDILQSHPSGVPVPAISLMQPWAGAVAWIGKDVENRTRWPFKYRGPILIHASASRPYREDFTRLRKLATKDGVEKDIVDQLDPDNEDFLDVLFDFGAIVAVAELADVFGPNDTVLDDHPAADSPWADDEKDYWLYFSKVVAVSPVPYKGAVGMFKVPYEVAAELQRHPTSSGPPEEKGS